MPRIPIVLVRYSTDINVSWLFKTFDSRLIYEIWTRNPETLHNNKFNQAFEFSGYQEGLRRILADYPNDTKLNIIFINDTAFSSHTISLTKFMLKQLHNIYSIQRN